MCRRLRSAAAEPQVRHPFLALDFLPTVIEDLRSLYPGCSPATLAKRVGERYWSFVGVFDSDTEGDETP
jgi:hypothetical protein